MFIYTFNHGDYTFTNKMPFNYNILFYSYDSVIQGRIGSAAPTGGGPLAHPCNFLWTYML